ncbi:Nucleoid occlusion protein [subsurface metagenome]
MNQIKHIRLDKIKPPEFDARLTPSPQEDDELRDSIKELGVLLPLLVKDVGDGYEIIAGNRRYREASRAGLTAVPCEVLKVTGAQSDKIKLHENLKRLPLSHIDQSQTFAHLIKEYNLTEKQVAALSGMSTGYVSEHLALLHADDNLLQAVHDGRLNFTVARELNRCKDSEERSRLQRVTEENGATAFVVKGWVQDSNRETDRIKGESTTPPPYSGSTEPNIPHYPCSVCHKPTRYDFIKRNPMCPDCDNIFHLTIEQDRLRQRQENNKPDP